MVKSVDLVDMLCQAMLAKWWEDINADLSIYQKWLNTDKRSDSASMANKKSWSRFRPGGERGLLVPAGVTDRKDVDRSVATRSTQQRRVRARKKTQTWSLNSKYQLIIVCIFRIKTHCKHVVSQPCTCWCSNELLLYTSNYNFHIV